jgi:hypothetical protein
MDNIFKNIDFAIQNTRLKFESEEWLIKKLKKNHILFTIIKFILFKKKIINKE